jgi:hypothetical protein
MKTEKLISAVATLSLVLFISFASIADSGNLIGTVKKSLDITNTSDQSFNYLRFHVNDFVSKSEHEEMELPAATEFQYLRFDVNNFTKSNPIDLIDMPVNDFEYLRLGMYNYTTKDTSMIDELPETEL